MHMPHVSDRVACSNSFQPIFGERQLRNASRAGRVLIARSDLPSAAAETIAGLAGLGGAAAT
jgi:hypothetical protein